MDSSSELDPEILDNLYKHQLLELREFTLKLDDTRDINRCRKWLQIFNKTSEDEKVARNCLCALLCQQLKTCGCLAMPFTDLSNCNRDLTQVLTTLDQSFTNTDSYSIMLSSRATATENYDSDEVDKLKKELLQITQQRDEKETRIRELTLIIENCNRCEMENDILKKIITVLDGLTTEKCNVDNYWIFRQLFGEENNVDLYNKLTVLDQRLHGILQENAKNQVWGTRNRLTTIIKRREDLLKKYKEDLRMQKWQQKITVKVIKLQFCSILSRVFLKSRQKSQSQVFDLFNQLEDKYKDILMDFNRQG